MSDRQFLLLVRHAAAEKNARNQFAGDDGSDRLTVEGDGQVARLVEQVTRLRSFLPISSIAVFHAGSGRASATAIPLAASLGVTPCELEGLRSIKAGVAAGMNEVDLWTEHREFAIGLHLYRSGVLSSYDIPYPAGGEKVVSFEASVHDALNVLSRQANDLSIAVGHRSSITATLLHYARMHHNYPRDFFGYIPLEPGVSSCVELTVGGGGIRWINRPIDANALKTLILPE